MRLSKALEGYWLDKEFELSPNTVLRYRYIHNRLIAFLGDVELDEIDSQDIKRFIRHLRTETSLSKRTIYDAWHVMSAFWSWAEKELGIEHVIRGKVDKPKFTKRTIEPLTMGEVKSLVQSTTSTRQWTTRTGKKVKAKRPTAMRDKAIILVMVDCGIRVTELCDLQVKDYHPKRGRLFINHGKGDKERPLPLGTRGRKALWRYLSNRSDATPAAPLFAAKSGSILDRNNVRHMLNRVAKHAGVPNVHPHRLRHTFAIEFLRNGGNPIELKELLGHETLEMVTVYVQLAEVDIEKAQRKASPADNWKL
ncbi:MAG: tyrosine-type recombinase/integrase [Chloroflexota bacterium]